MSITTHLQKKIKTLRGWKKQAWKDDTTPDEPVDKFVREFGHIPPTEWLHHACLGKKPSTKTKQEFLTYLKRHLKPTNKWADSWINHHLLQEFVSIQVFESQKFDWWEILNCNVKATWDEIKQAYKTLAMQYHPDVYNGEDAHEKMVQINNAFAKAKAQYKSDLEESF